MARLYDRTTVFKLIRGAGFQDALYGSLRLLDKFVRTEAQKQVSSGENCCAKVPLCRYTAQTTRACAVRAQMCVRNCKDSGDCGRDQDISSSLSAAAAASLSTLLLLFVKLEQVQVLQLSRVNGTTTPM